MSVFALSLVTMCIIYKGKPYMTGSKGLVLINEFIVSWCCALCIAYTPGYLQMSFSIASNIGIAVLGFAALVMFIGLISLIYSVYWQLTFNSRRKQNRLAKIELEKQRAEMKKLRRLNVSKTPMVVEEPETPVSPPEPPAEDSDSDMSYTNLRQKQR